MIVKSPFDAEYAITAMAYRFAVEMQKNLGRVARTQKARMRATWMAGDFGVIARYKAEDRRGSCFPPADLARRAGSGYGGIDGDSSNHDRSG